MTVAVAQTDAYRAAKENVAWVNLSHRQVLRMTGPDRVSFLQGMVTQDVAGAKPVYAATLTPKGAMVSDLRVIPLENELLIECASAETVAAHLNKYLISEEAEIHLAPELGVVGLLGPKAQALPGAIATMPDLLGQGLDMIFPRPLPAVPKGMVQVDAATYEVLRVEAGIPQFGVDMSETTIPLEANLERAIHYQKGCYIGQEVIARATYRGQMAKRLVGLLFGASAPAVGSELRRADKKVGVITSVVQSVLLNQFVGLGYVHRDSLQPGTELVVAPEGTAIVAELPFNTASAL